MNRLKELRLEHELTQTELANAINTSQRNISRWEKNEIEMGLNFAILLANYFNVSVEYLAGETDDFGVKTTSTVTSAAADDGLSDKEKEIIDIYRQLNGPCQELVVSMLYNLQRGSSAASSNNTQNNKRA